MIDRVIAPWMFGKGLRTMSVQNEHPPIGAGGEPRRTLLWTAATTRPLDEVASLVRLLKETGEVPSPGDEALRAAAVGRPLEEVRRLVGLLNEPPHGVGEADTALRAVATDRPIEDVAELVAILGVDKAARAEQPAQPVTVEPREPAAPQPQATLAVKAPAPSAMGSPLRWPAAVALLVIGTIHLPADFAGLRSGDVGSAVSLGIAVLCLVLAIVLTVQDTVWTWAASAAAGIGTVALHSVASGFGSVDLLRHSLGNEFGWATTAAVCCAVLAAVLAGSALLRRQKPSVVANDA